MQNKPSHVVVLLSQPLGVGQRDNASPAWDTVGTSGGTVTLKLLAHKFLSRDKGQDKEDWNERFEERAAILEFDGGMSRAEAEAQAIEQLNQYTKARQ